LKEQPQLQNQLDKLVSTGRLSLRRQHFWTGFPQQVQRYLVVCSFSALVYAVLSLLGRVFHSESLRVSLENWLWAAALYFVVVSCTHIFRSWQHRVDRQRTLMAWDQQCHLSDRLSSADQFLAGAKLQDSTDQAQWSGEARRQIEFERAFQLAAVEDAATHIQKTAEQRLHALEHAQPPRGLMVLLASCFLFFSIGAWFAKWPPLEVVSNTETKVPERPQNQAAEQVLRDDIASSPLATLEWQQKAAQVAKAQVEPTTISHSTGSPEQEEAKQTPGSTQSGRSAAATASTGSGNAQGTPTKQGQISKQSDTKTKAKPKKAKKPKPQSDADLKKKQDEEQSGATSGRGSSKGSNRNPAASDWSSRDHVNTPDDDDLDTESEVEDDEEEQEARGGMQPSLRDRRPPVSRDLSIGFGNRPNPDANGRGGPGQQKKSRGTASLVLGVPIPDRVKGQPNPGRTKITQEAVQPQVEASEAIEASLRQARSQVTSPLHRMEVQPWLHAVVRNYFLQRRAQQNQKS